MDESAGASAAPATMAALEAESLGSAVKQLAAIAHEGRLAVLRRLIQAGPSGESAGALARASGVQASTMSAQLSVLTNADLVRSRRAGRQIFYAADYATMRGLLGFLLEDCCCRHPEICEPGVGIELQAGDS